MPAGPVAAYTLAIGNHPAKNSRVIFTKFFHAIIALQRGNLLPPPALGTAIRRGATGPLKPGKARREGRGPPGIAEARLAIEIVRLL